MPNLSKLVKLTEKQYDTLSNTGTVGSQTGLSNDKLYLVQEAPKKSHIVNFFSNGGVFVPPGTPSGAYISYIGSAEIDYLGGMARIKMSMWARGSGGWTSSNFNYFTPEQMLAVLGLNTDYEFDVTRLSPIDTAPNYILGTIIWNNTGSSAGYQGYGPYVWLGSDNWISIARVYDVTSARAIGAWGHAQGFDCNGITMDFVLPFRKKV